MSSFSEPVLAGPSELTGRKRWREGARAHAGALLVGAIFLALTLIYNAAIPLWESDNEWAHYQYARYIALNHRLPRPDTQIAVPPSSDLCQIVPATGTTTVHQFRQPPLYYLLGSVVLSGFDVHSDLPVVSNPHIRTSHSQDDHNVAVHTDAENFPYRGPVLAVHTLRLLSALIGLAGLAAAYLSGLLLFPRRILAVAMMAVNAFIPQYVLSSAVVSNDILVGALGSWCAYLCLWFLLRRPNPWVLGAAMLVTGMAIMTKYSGLVLLPMVGLTLLITLVQSWRHNRSRFGRRLAATIGVVGLASIPIVLWLNRNQALYGHVFGAYADVTTSFVQGVLAPADQVSSGRLLDPLHAAGFAFMTFWGFFGSETLALPHGLVAVLGAVSLAALAGVALTILDKRQPVLRIAAAAALLVLVGAFVVNFVKSAGTSEPPGRYFLPIYSTACFTLVLGLDRLTPVRWQRGAPLLLPAALLVLTLAIPLLLIQPLYAPPPRSASTALLAGEEPVDAVFGDFAEMLGYRVEPKRIGLFDTVDVTLVWRSLQETPNNYTVALHLLDGANTPHGWTARFPGRGNYATSLWQPGEVLRDTYTLALNPSARGLLPSLGRIKVTMYCYSPEGDSYLDATDQAGNLLGDAVYLGRIKLADEAPAQPPVGAPALYTFGEEIALEEASFAPQVFPFAPELAIDLRWRALAQPARDYTVFAHLVDAAGATVAAYDLPLTGGAYPSGLWEAGERVAHSQRLPMLAPQPEGVYTLTIGLYDPDSGARLPVADASGTRQTNDAATLGAIEFPGYFTFIPNVWRGQMPDDSP
ncbi:MAG: phospholipid carrier-dependent glycosyltransferase [Anaerolineae bacterium]